jgi:hypothetical protein
VGASNRAANIRAFTPVFDGRWAAPTNLPPACNNNEICKQCHASDITPLRGRAAGRPASGRVCPSSTGYGPPLQAYSMSAPNPSCLQTTTNLQAPPYDRHNPPRASAKAARKRHAPRACKQQGICKRRRNETSIIRPARPQRDHHFPEWANLQTCSIASIEPGAGLSGLCPFRLVPVDIIKKISRTNPHKSSRTNQIGLRTPPIGRLGSSNQKPGAVSRPGAILEFAFPV